MINAFIEYADKFSGLTSFAYHGFFDLEEPFPLTKLLSAFPDLSHLSLHGIYLSDISPMRHANLKELSYDAHEITTILQQISLPNLTHLNADPSNNTAKECQAFFSQLSLLPKLLHWGTRYFETVRIVPQLKHFKPSESFCSLTLNSAICSSDLSELTAYPWWSNLKAIGLYWPSADHVSELQTQDQLPKLEHLALHLDPDTSQALDALENATLANNNVSLDLRYSRLSNKESEQVRRIALKHSIRHLDISHNCIISGKQLALFNHLPCTVRASDQAEYN